MIRKTEIAYRQVFQYVNDNLFNLSSKSIMSDFETAMRNALRTVPLILKSTVSGFIFVKLFGDKQEWNNSI